MEGSNNLSKINRRQSQSDNVSYSDSIVLHETSRSKIVLVPFFISKSDRIELAVKITKYKKKGSDFYIMNEGSSLSLNETASRKLLTALKSHLAVAKENDNGNYLVIKVNEGAANLDEHDPALVAKALTRVLSQSEIIEHLKGVELSEELITSLKTTIKLKEMSVAVETLRTNLNLGEDKEQVYQEWCEKHSWAFGSAYIMRDDVRNISSRDKLDLILPNAIAGYRDIVELKKPSMTVLIWDDTHQNYYFGSEVSKAIGQCQRYLDVFQEEASKGLRDYPEIVAYYPRAVIVIGRSNNWEEKQTKALHGLNSRLNGISVMTYDQLLAQGERLVSMVSPNTNSIFDDDISNLETFDDDIPF